jgi:hypothetical protein
VLDASKARLQKIVLNLSVDCHVCQLDRSFVDSIVDRLSL